MDDVNYEVWCEHDIGIARYLYESEKQAEAAAREACAANGLDYDELKKENLIHVDMREVLREM